VRSPNHQERLGARIFEAFPNMMLSVPLAGVWNCDIVLEMPRFHIVESGEHISAIAVRYGFSNYRAIWELEANERLRALRKDPHQLAPGDKVTIPNTVCSVHERSTGATHTFVVYVEKLKLRLRLRNLHQKPLADVAVKLTVGGATIDLVSDQSGLVATPVSRDCVTGKLQLGDGYEYSLAIGALGPIEERSGLVARLTNLGFWYGSDDQPDDPDALRLAVELFQSDQGLKPTGEVDSDFVQRLGQVHDCKE
jgi:hypothetical protein